jgi:outer membrane receptor for ferrienterochelin and colicins
MRYFTIISILLSCVNISFSQEKNDTIQWSKNLDQVVITAQFAPTDARETVNTVRVLSKKIIEQRAAVNLQELLQTEPNIRLTQDAILGSELSINGLKGENLKILIDGVPIVGRLNGNIDAGQIPLSSIQKIEIIEGAQSLLYGSEASGGVVNLITRKSQMDTLDAELSGQYESNGFRNLTAKLGYSKGKFTAQATGSLMQFVPLSDSLSNRDQLWNPKNQQSARLMLRYQADKNSEIRLTGNILSEKVDNLGEKRRLVFKPYAFDDYYFTDRRDINFFAEKWTKARQLMQATLGWNTFSRIKNSYRYDFDEEKNELLAGMQDTSAANGYLARLTFAGDDAKKKINYLLGLENYAETASGTRLYDSNAVSHPHRALTNDLGVFGSIKYKPSAAFTLQTGTRWTWNLRYGSAITPSTWLLWRPRLPFQARFSWAYGFRSPSVKELFFSFVDINHFVKGKIDLQPEKSLNLRAELIWKTIHMGGDNEVIFTSAAFYNKINDRIILTALGPVHYEYQNIETWKTSGASLRVNINAGSIIRFQSDIITTGFHNSGTQSTHSSYLWSTDWANDLTFTFMHGKLSWNVWHKLSGKTPFFFNQDGKTLQTYTDSWQMLNSGISTHLFNRKWKINAGVKNIFDIRQLKANINNGIHIEASNQQNLHWGRNVYFGLMWQI